MPFVKLDCSILDSTLWSDRDAREVFITALLMASPMEFKQPMEQLEIRSLKTTGWTVPPGWYGFIPAAGVGIVRRAGVPQEDGLRALETLASPEMDGRSVSFDGRRLVRVDGGFVVLNFMKYRDHDYSSAERQKRYRERQKTVTVSNGVTALHGDKPLSESCVSEQKNGHATINGAHEDQPALFAEVPKTEESSPPSRRYVTASRRNITQAEAEAEAEVRTGAVLADSTRALPPEVELWNSKCGNLASVSSMNATRSKHLAARRKDPFWSANLESAIERIQHSKFCQGGGGTGWRADFDWLLQPNSVAKIMEGKYDDRRRLVDHSKGF